MRLALAVDTTAEYGSVALADEAGVREEVLLHAPQGFGQVIFGAIEGLLRRQGVALREIDVFAGASGPGSFTGVRVGLAAVKGLAEVTGKRVVAISNLEAIAQYGSSSTRVAVIDARRGEVFAAVFDGAGHVIIAESVLPLDRFVTSLPDREMEWISENVASPARFQGIKAPQALAGMMAKMALCREALDPAAIEANYLRRSDAELLWKEM